jgi:hypothetical protein
MYDLIMLIKKSSYKNLIRFQSSKFSIEQKENYYGNTHIKLRDLYESNGTIIWMKWTIDN